MSVIAAKITDNVIEVSADSIITKDCVKGSYQKLYKKDDLIYGGAGDADQLCIFFDYMSYNKPKCATVSSILEFMREFQVHLKTFIEDRNNECSYVLAFDGKLFEIDGVFVREVTTYTACGAGEQYARAAMELGHSTVDAVYTASKLCHYVEGPITTYTIERVTDEKY